MRSRLEIHLQKELLTFRKGPLYGAAYTAQNARVRQLQESIKLLEPVRCKAD